jgi:hypothetical protein
MATAPSQTSVRAKSEKNLNKILAKSSRPISAVSSQKPGLTLMTSIGENIQNV